MKALFPGECIICHASINRGQEIVDSGMRGPRGGKKMVHAGCAAHTNPIPGPDGMAIPGDYPDWPYDQFGPDPQVANWTSYPQYSYEQFYRTNPAPRARRNFFFSKKEAKKAQEESPEIQALLQRRADLAAALASVPKHSDAWFDLQGEYNMVDRRISLLRAGVKLNPARAVYAQMPDNAGPYLPETFPYGVGGRPASYTTAPKKAKKNRGGPFLKPSTRSWPVSDRKHAKIAIQYMTRGFGGRSEYPTLIRRLADHYPVEDSANRAIWTMYRKEMGAIEAISGKKMPSMRELRARASRVAANPSRRRRKKR